MGMRLSILFLSSSKVISAEPDWFAAYEKERSEKEALRRLKEDVNKKAKRTARIKKMKEEHGTTRWSAKRKVHNLMSIPPQDT